MRDPDRIPVVLAALQEAWEASPDMRLGQLLMNLGPRLDQSGIWNAEDCFWLDKAAEWAAGKKKEDEV